MITKRTYSLTLVAIAVGLAFQVTALAEENLLNGKDARTEFRFGLFADDMDGSQDWAREYDGRRFDVWSLERLDSYGYNGPYQYWLEARDLVVRDEDVNFSLDFKNTLGLKLSTSSLAHRLARIPAVNPFLATGDTFVDLSPGAKFEIDRRVNDFGIRTTPGRSQRFRFVADWRQETEDGSQQVLFRARETTDAIANRERGGAAIPINRDTNQGTLGADLQIAEGSALNYRFLNTEFSEKAGRALAGSPEDVAPLNSLTRINGSTQSHIFKARSRIGDRLYFTGVHIDKDRDNETASLVDRSDVKMDSTNLALSFLAGNTLTLTGRYRKVDSENNVALVLEDTVPENQPISREIESYEIDVTYTGIRRTLLRLGFEDRDVNRSTEPLRPESEGFEVPYIQSHTKSDIWRASLRYRPSLRFSLSGNFELWNVKNCPCSGVPNDREKISMNATYLVRDNLALYGDFLRWDDKNDTVRVPLSEVETQATIDDELNPDYELIRSLAAGQGYRNEFTTTNIGAWYAVNPRLTFDVNFGSVEVDAGALWVLGIETAFPPHLKPDLVPYEASDDQWSVGATYVLGPRWRLHGRFLNSNSQGRSLINLFLPGDPDTRLDVGPVWTPVDVDQNRYTIGFAYEISSKDRLLFDFSVADWEDNIDTANDGRYNLWRLAWSTRL